MLKICLIFCKSKPQYAYKHYAYKKTCTSLNHSHIDSNEMQMYHTENIIDILTNNRAVW